MSGGNRAFTLQDVLGQLNQDSSGSSADDSALQINQLALLADQVSVADAASLTTGPAPAAVLGTRVNLATNPRLGTSSTTNWGSQWFGGGSNSGTTGRVADSKFASGYAFQKKWTVVGSNSADTAINYKQTGLIAGSTYSFGAAIWGNCAQPYSLSVEWYNSSNASLRRDWYGGSSGASEPFLTPNASPVVVTMGGLVAPANTSYAVMHVGHNNSFASGYGYSVGDFINVCQVISEQASTSGVYFDGSTPSWSPQGGETWAQTWNGTADASASTATLSTPGATWGGFKWGSAPWS